MRALIASLIIALAVGVTGCGPSDDAGEDVDAAPATEESAPATEESAPADEESAPADEGSTEE